ncbi:MAG TPA: transcriptional repressor [Candidatus Cloacimonadota bacterium]|nr:transcriptional repressor [Candidatus Cloacimonadota bacterium]
MQQPEIIFSAFLTHKGLKFTPARQLILQTVFKLHEHFDREQLYEQIHKVNRDVSRATVYRTIPLLVEAGLVQKSMRSETRDEFEHIYGHPKHAHLICRNCGAIAETGLQQLEKQILNIAKVQNFQLETIKLEITGLCWKCQSDENASH